MRKFIALGVAFAVLAIAAAAAAGSNPNTLTLAVYGDAPYLDKTRPDLPARAEFDATPQFIQTINGDSSVQDVIHVGDIHSGSEACTKAYDQAVYDLWTQFQRPLVYTPGDNEWTDCTKSKELKGKDIFGHGPDDNGDPLIHLGYVRSIFFSKPGWTLGQHPMQVISQAQAFDPAYPADKEYVENVMWEQSKTLFVTINVPGGSNNDTDTWNGPATNAAAQTAERERRTAADIRWLNAAFAKADADNAHSVVIVTQADMWDLDGHLPSEQHLSNYEGIISTIAGDTSAYGKPVLLFNGDSHTYRSDNPLQQGSTCYTEGGTCADDDWDQHPYYDVPNFHRIVVHGSSFPLEWLKLWIDPRAAWENIPSPTSWGPFSWERETQSQLTPSAG